MKKDTSLKTYEISENVDSFLNEPNLAYSVSQIRYGISYSDFSAVVAKSPFDYKDWSSFLHISERTFQRYNKLNQHFEPLQSERIIEITRLYRLGYEIFGEEKNFARWLEMQNLALGNVTPKSLLDSIYGISSVMDELHKIGQGILA